MTIPMPEPVAHIYPSTLKEFESSECVGEAFSIAVGNVDTGEHSVSLITTTQAEAYAAAKVREALELAAQTCENQGRATTTLDGESFYIALGQAARAIRALIPPLPGPVEPRKNNE